MFRSTIFLISLFGILHANEEKKEHSPTSSHNHMNHDENLKSDEHPWFTGPLLTSGAYATPTGRFNVQPYLYYNDSIGYINNHWVLHRAEKPPSNFNLQLPIHFGLVTGFDILVSPQFLYAYEGSTDSWRFGDLVMSAEYQFNNHIGDIETPTFLVNVTQIFPTGKFEFLNAAKMGTDSGGGGAYATKFHLVGEKMWAFQFPHYLDVRAAFAYEVFTSVRVHGINSYGGDPTTNGTVNPGNAIHFLVGFEYSLTRNWALALDIVNVYTEKTTFRGNTVAPVGKHQDSYKLSFAPAFEYNWNADMGLVAGLWFTAFGKNVDDFLSFIVSFNYVN